MKSLIPKVLIACPTSVRHSHVFDSWLDNLSKLNYPNFDILLVDTSPDNEDYFNKLKEKKLKDKKIIVLRHKWDYKKYHPVQMLAQAREKIRQYFLENDYEHLFFLDDDIFVPKYSIQKLLSYNKDCAGFYVHIYYGKDKSPCVLKSGEVILGHGLDLFTFDEINAYKDYVKRIEGNKLSAHEKSMKSFIVKDKWHPQLFKTYAVNLGCLMIKRKVLENVPFRFHDKFLFGEDLWFFAEANDKNFEFWCDTSEQPEHRNTEWNSVIQKGPKQVCDFYLAMGPANADKIVFIKRDKEK